ncbi:MAG TPA: uroporphyrinogen-III synthase [Steroidobacteraceae bacterium]|nr:uroporphyrinogen-III synthase [Steroidobacteraceae bacterium]
MIPLAVAPLKGVTVLVTRPQEQSRELYAKIISLGGEAIFFPTIEIEAQSTVAPKQEYDWVIFISANAVRHGLARIERSDHTRVAAIGKATAAVLESFKVRVDLLPEKDSNSEALLAHPLFSNVAGQNILIVKGEGGRGLLQESLMERGAKVTTLDAYRRVRPQVDATTVEKLERCWRDDGISIVTITSVEILDNLLALLTDAGKLMLQATPFVTVSKRIVDAVRAKGITSPYVLSRSADDAAIVGAIAAWHARAR